MATALTAWFSAPAPTTWTSTAPVCRMTPAIAPATELGLDLLETLRTSMCSPGCRRQSSNRDAQALRRAPVPLLLSHGRIAQPGQTGEGHPKADGRLILDQ